MFYATKFWRFMGYTCPQNCHMSIQEVMRKIVAEKARYRASQEFKTQMQKNPTLLIELLELV